MRADAHFKNEMSSEGELSVWNRYFFFKGGSSYLIILLDWHYLTLRGSRTNFKKRSENCMKASNPHQGVCTSVPMCACAYALFFMKFRCSQTPWSLWSCIWYLDVKLLTPIARQPLESFSQVSKPIILEFYWNCIHPINCWGKINIFLVISFSN